MELLIMQFPPISRHCNSLRSNYSPQTLLSNTKKEDIEKNRKMTEQED
jgi:hypothetical protein